MTKLERLLNLIAALIHTVVPMTAEEIREEVEGYGGASEASFRRAFERDKDELRSMGIPITVSFVPGTDPPLTGYRIDGREYAGAIPELTPDELATLHLASNLVRVQGLPTEAAFWKIGGAPAVHALDEPIVALPDAASVGPLFRAVSERRLTRFRYNGQDRVLEPQRLLLNRGHWYISGVRPRTTGRTNLPRRPHRWSDNDGRARRIRGPAGNARRSAPTCLGVG